MFLRRTLRIEFREKVSLFAVSKTFNHSTQTPDLLTYNKTSRLHAHSDLWRTNYGVSVDRVLNRRNEKNTDVPIDDNPLRVYHDRAKASALGVQNRVNISNTFLKRLLQSTNRNVLASDRFSRRNSDVIINPPGRLDPGQCNNSLIDKKLKSNGKAGRVFSFTSGAHTFGRKIICLKKD